MCNNNQEEYIKICAWCDSEKKLTKAFERDGYTTTHGICKTCRDKALAIIKS